MHLGPENAISEIRKAFLRAFTRLFRIFSNGFGPAGKALISHNVETFVCDGSDNGVA